MIDRQARLAYGEELLKQAEADAQRRRAWPLTNKPHRADLQGMPVPLADMQAAEAQVQRRGPSTLERRKEDRRARRDYGHELLRQAEEDQQRRRVQPVTGS